MGIGDLRLHDFAAKLAVWAALSCCIWSAGQFIRNPKPHNYIEINKGFPLTGEVQIQLGDGVVATTMSVGDKHVVHIERKEQ